jgi:hypothetical protein
MVTASSGQGTVHAYKQEALCHAWIAMDPEAWAVRVPEGNRDKKVLGKEMGTEPRSLLFFLLFICTYNVWVISPLFSPPPPLTNPPPSTYPHPLNIRQKLFCPYL